MSENVVPEGLQPGASIHFMGLGGIGVSGLARILLQRGYQVSGCDLTPSALTAELAARGATVYTGHDPAHLDGVDLLVMSAAVPQDNPELAAARSCGLPTVKRAELLGRLLSGLRTIAVAGTHGKTTTSALTAMILLEAGLDPTAFIGGLVPHLIGPNTHSNARAGHDVWAVVEADEYDASFLHLTPEIAILTNVEADHLDYYGDLAGVVRAFRAFIAQLPEHGVLIACADDAVAMQIAADAPCRLITYGLDHAADWRAIDVRLDENGAHFTIRLPDGEQTSIQTRLSARHNVGNALAACAAAATAGVSIEHLVSALARFEPPRRRQEVKGYTSGGALLIDDYAHHPTEIRSTLAGLRTRYPGRRLRVVFQPHTYRRTRDFLHDTAASFAAADEVAITEIYAARGHDSLGVSGADVVSAAVTAGVPATFAATLEDAVAWLARDDGHDVLLVTMGAGDIWKAGDMLRVAK